MSKDLNFSSLKQYVDSEFCLTCRGCCRYSDNPSIWSANLLEQEKGALNLEGIRLIIHNHSYICPLLEPKTHLCRIYARRPLECRLYPFLINRCGSKLYLGLDLNCLFIKDKANSREFKDYADYLIGYLREPAVLAMLKNNRQNFSAYPADNVMNLRELET